MGKPAIGLERMSMSNFDDKRTGILGGDPLVRWKDSVEEVLIKAAKT